MPLPRQGEVMHNNEHLPLTGIECPEKATIQLSLPCSASAEWGRCPEGAEGVSARSGEAHGKGWRGQRQLHVTEGGNPRGGK